MFINPFPDAFALDIGDLSIKLVQLKNKSFFASRRPAFDIATYRSTTLPGGLIINGEIEKPEHVRKYIQHLLAGNKKGQRPVHSRWVTASLPDTQGFIKLIHIEKKEEDVIEEDIIFAAKRHIPFDEDEYYVDWQIIPRGNANEEKTDVLIGAVPKRIADMYTYLLESLGLGVIALEIEALATARAMITAEKEYKEQARAILDIGAVRTTLIIFDHDHIQFSRSLPYSGEIVTTAIAQKLHITNKEAEVLKRKDGAQYKKSAIWPVMSKMTDQLVKEIEKTFDFYYSHFPEANKITHVTMCGGGSATKQLDKLLSLKLKVSSKPGHVWKNLFTKKFQEVVDQESLNYATAIGLALRAADNPLLTKDTI